MATAADIRPAERAAASQIDSREVSPWVVAGVAAELAVRLRASVGFIRVMLLVVGWAWFWPVLGVYASVALLLPRAGDRRLGWRNAVAVARIGAWLAVLSPLFGELSLDGSGLFGQGPSVWVPVGGAFLVGLAVLVMSGPSCPELDDAQARRIVVSLVPAAVLTVAIAVGILVAPGIRWELALDVGVLVLGAALALARWSAPSATPMAAAVLLAVLAIVLAASGARLQGGVGSTSARPRELTSLRRSYRRAVERVARPARAPRPSRRRGGRQRVGRDRHRGDRGTEQRRWNRRCAYRRRNIGLDRPRAIRRALGLRPPPHGPDLSSRVSNATGRIPAPHSSAGGGRSWLRHDRAGLWHHVLRELRHLMQRAQPASLLAGATIAGVGAACFGTSLHGLLPSPQVPLAGVAAIYGAGLFALAAARHDQTGGLYAGVAGRLAPNQQLAWAFRAGVVLAAPLAGFGVAAYAAAALLVTLTAPPTAGPVVDWRRSTGTAMLGLAVVLAVLAAGIRVGTTGLLWAVLLIGSGLALFWGAAGAWRGPEPDTAWDDANLRTALGLLLAGAGAWWVLSRTGLFHQAGQTIVGTSVALSVIVLVAGPRWLRTRRLLTAERVARVRAQERAEMADHLHDSVLQTLALIQRRADDPAGVVTLARAQERDLRDWLLNRPGEPPERSFAAGLRAIAAAVEDAHGVTIEVVIVGDLSIEDSTEALLAAANEALVNAAKHAAGAPISLFARIEERRVSVYVHDRGPGFTLDAVAPERRGVRESIIGRMSRHGGHAEVRSAPGEGCEVLLFMDRR